MGRVREVTHTVNMHIMNIRWWENRRIMDKNESTVYNRLIWQITAETKQWHKMCLLDELSVYPLLIVSSCFPQAATASSTNPLPCLPSRCVRPCDSCFSCLRCGSTSPSRDDEDFAISHSRPHYIHPAGTASVFSFHMIGVTPHSCYNFSVAHKNLLGKPQSHVFWIFSLFPFTASRSLSFFLYSLTHKRWSLALVLLIGPFSSCESIPFMCIWGLWLSLTTGWQRVEASISVGGFQRSLRDTERPLMGRALWTQSHPETAVCEKHTEETWKRPPLALTSLNYNTVIIWTLSTRRICSSVHSLIGFSVYF